jgi:glutamyl-tRNA reductase
MDSFDAFCEQLADRNREDIIRALRRRADSADASARRGSRARLGSTERNRSEMAKHERNRIGRILNFLIHGDSQLATGATEADIRLCRIFEQKLRTKGQWGYPYDPA